MQQSPSNKVYAQALERLKSLVSQYSSTKTRDVDTVSTEVNKTLYDLSTSLGPPTLKYKELSFGEVPVSFKINEFLESLAYDINVMLDEMEIVKAGSIHTHNFIRTEILKSQQQNDRLHNKIKSLQLYSNSEDKSIMYLGDHFYNDDLIDWDMVDLSARVNLSRGNSISLGIAAQDILIDTSTKIVIDNGSNGIVGNNQEVLPVYDTVESSIYFVGESDRNKPEDHIKSILDQQPNTFFEFEKYLIPQSYRDASNNLNFDYKLIDSPTLAYLKEVTENNDRFIWADGLNGPLRLNLTIDIGSVKTASSISLDPYGLSDNKNAPILIRKVSVSSDKSNWFDLNPQNVWVANGIDQNSVNVDGENIIIGTAHFRTNGIACRYVRLQIEQSVGRPTQIGHMYYVDPDDETEERQEGPVPIVDRIWEEKDTKNSYQNGVVQRREVFPGQRWAIGIRDITIYGDQYSETSTMISKRFDIPGGVDRVSLEADIDQPSDFAVNTAWVRFFISPDDGNSWHQISRIQEDYLGIPEIIAYNDNTPAELRIPGVQYYETIKTPTSLRMKIEIDRPSGDNTVSPVVKSYKLKVKQRVTL